MPTAAVNGALLHYEVVGEGPTCLVLHGWLGTDHTYLRPGLDALAGDLRLVYYDHRGHGRSGGSMSDPLTLEQLADDADALAAHLGEDKVLVLGHHTGAAVAQEMALAHPERVAGLILIAATPGELGREESLADGLDALPTPPEVEVLQRVPPGTDEELAATMQALSSFFFHPAGAAEDRAPFARSTFHSEPAVQAMATLGWWTSVDRLADVGMPALVLVGRHDVFAGPHQAERLGRHLPWPTMVVVEGGGHLPWVEEPAAVLDAVRGWLVDASI